MYFWTIFAILCLMNLLNALCMRRAAARLLSSFLNLYLRKALTIEFILEACNFSRIDFADGVSFSVWIICYSFRSGRTLKGSIAGNKSCFGRRKSSGIWRAGVDSIVWKSGTGFWIFLICTRLSWAWYSALVSRACRLSSIYRRLCAIFFVLCGISFAICVCFVCIEL